MDHGVTRPAEGGREGDPLAAGQFVQLSQLIAELDKIWSSGADFRACLEVICRLGREILDSDGACVLIPERERFRVIAANGDRAGQVQDACFSLLELGAAVARVLSGGKGESEECTERPGRLFADDLLLAEPIAVGDQAMGALVFTRRDCSHPFGVIEQAQSAMLACQASFAYHMLRRARELQLIYEVTRAINSSLRFEEVLEFIYQGISRILPTDNFYIALWDGSGEIRFEIEVEERKRLPKRSRKRAAGLTEYLLGTRRPLLIRRDFMAQCERLGIRFGGRPARCWMGAPMVFREKSVGVIALQSYELENVFDEDHLSVLENVAAQAAGAIENARLFQQTCASLEQLQTAQQLLLQSEKLAAVGQLISGIAHELNNPLTGVVGWTQYLMAQGVSENIGRHLATINEQAQRASTIVQNLLAFSRQHKPEQTLVDLSQILDRTLALRAYELRVNNITVHPRYAQGLPCVSADPHQLQQVFLNLIINAEQAILSARDSGNITVSAEQSGDVLRITVADDGPGIAADKLEKIFDPFFTTRSMGTGLGLPISLQIMREVGGVITAKNNPGGGATLRVSFPVPAEPPGPPED